MSKLSFACALVLSTLFVSAGVNAAKADGTYALDFTGSGGFAGSVGTVKITSVGTTEIDYVVNLTNGALWKSGNESFFAYVTGTINSLSVTGTNGGTWDAPVIGNISQGNPYDGLGSSLWDVNVDCSATN